MTPAEENCACGMPMLGKHFCEIPPPPHVFRYRVSRDAPTALGDVSPVVIECSFIDGEGRSLVRETWGDSLEEALVNLYGTVELDFHPAPARVVFIPQVEP